MLFGWLTEPWLRPSRRSTLCTNSSGRAAVKRGRRSLSYGWFGKLMRVTCCGSRRSVKDINWLEFPVQVIR